MASVSFPREQIKIQLLENIHQSAHDNFAKEGFRSQAVASSFKTDELIQHSADSHILGIRSKTQLESEYFEAATRLLAVGCFCIGTNQVDVDAARLKGIPVFNAPFSNTRSVAELIMAEIVMLARKLGDRNQMLHEGRWLKSASSCFEVRGKTLGIIGYGKIGSQVSILAEAFGMKVIFFDIVNKMPIGNAAASSTLEELLMASDFVSLHVPETPNTKGMVTADLISKMKPGSYLLNASRGSVVDLDALSAALKSKALAGAAIDVFPTEPKNNDDIFSHPLAEHENVILTPHIGGSTEEAQVNIGIEVSASLIKFINEGATTSAVNFPQLELPQRENCHRILNVHRNVPGVLAEINAIISKLGANIQQQQLATDSEIGYLIVDLDQQVSHAVKDEISKMSANIRTRILY